MFTKWSLKSIPECIRNNVDGIFMYRSDMAESR